MKRVISAACGFNRANFHSNLLRSTASIIARHQSCGHPAHNTNPNATKTVTPRRVPKTPSLVEVNPDDFEYCMQLVKSSNFEQYMIGLLFPKEYHDAFFVLHALNIELSRIKSVTSTPSTGQLRLDWWRQSVSDGIKGSPTAQPIIRALSVIAPRYELKARNFTQTFVWRARDLLWTQPPDLKAIEDYSDGTYGTLLNNLLRSLGIDDLHADHAAHHLGKAWGLLVLLRGTPYLAQSKSTYLPASICAKHLVSEEDIYRMQNKKEIEEVVFEVANQAKAHLDMCRSMAKDVPKDAYPVLYPAVLCEILLDRLQKENFDIFSAPLSTDQIRLRFQLKLLKAKFTGSY